MDQIIIPQNTLVVLCGPAGSGKSTFAMKHFQPTQVVSSDHCRTLVSDDPSNQQVTPQAFELMNFIVKKRLAIGRLTVADATFLKRVDRSPLIGFGRRFGFRTVAIVFRISLEVCLARNAGRSRTIPEEALRLQNELLEETLKTIREEGFDHVFLLGEKDQSTVSVRVK